MVDYSFLENADETIENSKNYTESRLSTDQGVKNLKRIGCLNIIGMIIGYVLIIEIIVFFAVTAYQLLHMSGYDLKSVFMFTDTFLYIVLPAFLASLLISTLIYAFVYFKRLRELSEVNYYFYQVYLTRKKMLKVGVGTSIVGGVLKATDSPVAQAIGEVTETAGDVYCAVKAFDYYSYLKAGFELEIVKIQDVDLLEENDYIFDEKRAMMKRKIIYSFIISMLAWIIGLIPDTCPNWLVYSLYAGLGIFAVVVLVKDTIVDIKLSKFYIWAADEFLTKQAK